MHRKKVHGLDDNVRVRLCIFAYIISFNVLLVSQYHMLYAVYAIDTISFVKKDIRLHDLL